MTTNEYLVFVCRLVLQTNIIKLWTMLRNTWFGILYCGRLIFPILTVERLTVIEWKFIVQDFNCYVLEVVLAFNTPKKILKSFQLKQVVRSCYA